MQWKGHKRLLFRSQLKSPCCLSFFSHEEGPTDKAFSLFPFAVPTHLFICSIPKSCQANIPTPCHAFTSSSSQFPRLSSAFPFTRLRIYMHAYCSRPSTAWRHVNDSCKSPSPASSTLRCSTPFPQLTNSRWKTRHLLLTLVPRGTYMVAIKALLSLSLGTLESRL